MHSEKTGEIVGRYLLDISKIVFGGVVVSGVFGSGGSVVVAIAFGIMLVACVTGVVLVRMSGKKE